MYTHQTKHQILVEVLNVGPASKYRICRIHDAHRLELELRGEMPSVCKRCKRIVSPDEKQNFHFKVELEGKTAMVDGHCRLQFLSFNQAAFYSTPQTNSHLNQIWRGELFILHLQSSKAFKMAISSISSASSSMISSRRAYPHHLSPLVISKLTPAFTGVRRLLFNSTPIPSLLLQDPVSSIPTAAAHMTDKVTKFALDGDVTLAGSSASSSSGDADDDDEVACLWEQLEDLAIEDCHSQSYPAIYSGSQCSQADESIDPNWYVGWEEASGNVKQIVVVPSSPATINSNQIVYSSPTIPLHSNRTVFAAKAREGAEDDAVPPSDSDEDSYDQEATSQLPSTQELNYILSNFYTDIQ